MMEWYILASNILTGGLHVTIGLFLIYRLLSVEKLGRKSLTIGLIGAFAITLILSLFHLSDFYRIALETVWIAVCANRLQKADTRISLFVSIFYEIGISFFQFLLGAGLGILFRSESFLDSTNLRWQIAVWLFNLLLVVLVLFISKQQMTWKGGYRLVTAIALVGFIGIITLSEQTILTIPDDTLDMWMILSIFLIMSIVVFNINRQYEVEKELARLKSEQADLLERDYITLNNAYSVNAKLFHDFHNHIGSLRQLLSHEKYDKALQYLDELQEPIREITDTVWTGDETVDYLINSKASMAAANQIQLHVQIEFPRHTNIKSADLCAILGNLLDNALEAVMKIPEPRQRVIHLVIRRINQMLVIKVENEYTDLPMKEDGQLKTTKTDNGLHGWGLKSAQTAAEKYDGMVRTTYEGNTFHAVATLSYHGISTK